MRNSPVNVAIFVPDLAKLQKHLDEHERLMRELYDNMQSIKCYTELSIAMDIKKE